MLIRAIALFTLIATVAATGRFTNPSGSDGSLTVATGDTIDISWTNISNYDILSIGYYSTSNQTITWLISNSQSHPTSFRWTVDVVAQGFDLTESRVFAFYACKDYNFGDPFISSYFVINDNENAGSATSTTENTPTPTPTPTPTTTAVQSTTTAGATSTSSSTVQTSSVPTTTTKSDESQPTSTTTSAPTTLATTSSSNDSSSTSNSASLSTGAKVGIALGVIAAMLTGAGLAYLLLRRRKQSQQGTNGAISNNRNPSAPISTYEKSHDEQRSYGNGMKYGPYSGVHEATGSQPNVNIDRSFNSRLGVAELGTSGWATDRAELPVAGRGGATRS